MKGIYLLFLLATTQYSFSQQRFLIKGSISGFGEAVSMIYLEYNRDGIELKDSTTLKNNKYSFSGTVTEPTVATLRAVYKNQVSKNSRNSFRIWLENSTTAIVHSDSFSNITVTGSVAYNDYLALSEKEKPFSGEGDSLFKEYFRLKAKSDTLGFNRTVEEIERWQLKSNEVYKTAFLANPLSPIAVTLLKYYTMYNIDVKLFDTLYNRLSPEARESYSGKQLRNKFDILLSTEIGNIAPLFVQNDTLGNPVSLANFRGRYVLLDFWASWCGPCRKEHPNYVRAYGRYKSKGFDIVGISLDIDTGKEGWLKAIRHDQLIWTQLSDLRAFDNAVAVQYGIHAIPANFLIDPNGIIIAKNLRGEELEKELEKLFR